MEKWTKGCIIPFYKKTSLEIIKKYRGITLTVIVAKVYYVLILNRIQSEVEKII